MTPPPNPPPEPSDPHAEMPAAWHAHAEAVHRHALRATFGDHQAAEDATQEAFAEAFHDWPRFRKLTTGQQRGWLCGRARWRVIDSWRDTRHEHPVDEFPEQPDPRATEDTILADITADQLWEAIIAAVPRRAAQAAYLRWHEGWTMVGIARHLGIDRASVLRDLNTVLETARQLTASKGGVA